MTYGLGTRSYNRSSEARQNKLAQRDATERYLREPKPEVILGPRCNCRSFRAAHDISAHGSLQSDFDWTPWEERYVFNAEYNCYDLRIQRWERGL